MNLTEEMRRLTEAAVPKYGKTPAQIAEEKAFIADCMNHNPFSARYLNCTKAMRLYVLAPALAVKLQEDAEITDGDRLAALEKTVRDMGVAVDNINEKLED